MLLCAFFVHISKNIRKIIGFIDIYVCKWYACAMEKGGEYLKGGYICYFRSRKLKKCSTRWRKSGRRTRIISARLTPASATGITG